MPDVVGWRVVVAVEPHDAELVADAMFTAGALGIEERSEADRVVLLAGMPDEAAARTFAASHPDASVEAVVDDRWADEWRAWAKPVLVAGVLLQPAWLPAERPSVESANWVVTLDPGRAFGSGGHETTRLALAAVLEHTRPGARLLDVGCGSGVLAVAAAVARDAQAVAVDVDPHAVQVTRENATRNEVEHLVEALPVAPATAAEDPLAPVVGEFDVVVANILAVTLREIAPAVARRLAPGGHVVLSGMLAAQVATVDAAYTAFGLHAVGERADGDWRCLVYARSA